MYTYEVPRVHCDYTATGAPRRLVQLGREGIYSKLRHRTLTEEEVGELASGRYAFINVWRSIDEDAPVMQQPLAVCDEHSVADKVPLLRCTFVQTPIFSVCPSSFSLQQI